MALLQVTLLQRMTDARLTSAELCSGADGEWVDGRCWLGRGWKAAAAAGLAAADDFNARSSRYVPQFASEAVQQCGVQLSVSVMDSGSTARHTLEQLTSSAFSARVVVGPLRSSVSEASALLLGVRDTPQVSYGSSSPTLSEKSLYPRFFRTFPSDASAASSICHLLGADQLGMSRLAIFYSANTYGEGYFHALQEECEAVGVEAQGWPYEVGSRESIGTAMSNLEASAASVVVCVFLDPTDLTMLIEAGLELGSLGKARPRQFILPEALDLDSVSSAAREVLHGSLTLRSIGGTTANPRWAAFAEEGWRNLSAASFNRVLPQGFHFNDSLFGPTFDAHDSSFLQNIGTYEYDAMAAVGLLACEVAPEGAALPADFGTRLWEAATSGGFEFEGLSGVVRFDEFGDRDKRTANIQLYNVLQASDGSVSESLVASYDGTRSVAWAWEGGSMGASGVVFNGGRPQPFHMLRVGLLQRMSDARLDSAELCSGADGEWADGTCWLGEGWQAAAAAGLAAADDFNARSSRYVPQFASETMRQCGVQLSVSVMDSGSTEAYAMGRLTQRLFTPDKPDIVVGPGRSAVALPTATILGVEAVDTLQISYWASSPLLSNKALYPRFMRTYPTDQATTVALCDFWKTTMGYTNAAIIYENDAYGEGFKESLVDACLQLGVNVVSFPFTMSDTATIEVQVERLADPQLRIILVVAVDDRGVSAIVDAAVAEGSKLGPGVPTWWFLTDFSGGYGALDEAARAVLHGSVQIKPTGAVATNPRWAAFAEEGWRNLSAASFNRVLPQGFHFNDSLFGPTFDAHDSSFLQNIGTYEYDAMAAVGLLACEVAPEGAALPADFGTRLWEAATSGGFEFEGLSGVVRFDEFGDRDKRTANIQLYNVLQASDGSVSESLVASYDGTRSVAWAWEGGSMGASGVVFNGGFSSPPDDDDVDTSSDGLLRTVIVVGCALGLVLGLAVVYILVWRHRHLKAMDRLTQANVQQEKRISVMAAAEAVSKLPLTQRETQILDAMLGPRTMPDALKRLQIGADEVQLKRAIGSGNFADVFIADWLGTPCAVKRLRRSRLTEQGLVRFQAEISLHVTLRHPNVVALLGCIVQPEEGKVQAILELCSRGTLEQVLGDPRAASLTWSAHKLPIALGIARAMAYLHTQDPPVVHRDLKPANVLVDDGCAAPC